MNNFLSTLCLRVYYDTQNKGQFTSLISQIVLTSSWRGDVFSARQELNIFKIKMYVMFSNNKRYSATICSGNFMTKLDEIN